MDILGLSTSPSSGGAYALILNENEGNRRLPIIIGTFEAQAIALELEHIKPPRPMTHDLMRNIIQSFESFVKYIFINNLKDGTFYAQVVYEHNGSEVEQDARPSDAIALAIRFKAPIYTSPHVLNEAGIVSEEDQGDVSSKASSEGAMAGANIPGTAPSTASSGSTSGDRLKQLEKKLEHAIKNEDYEKAAQIRDEIARIKE